MSTWKKLEINASMHVCKFASEKKTGIFGDLRQSQLDDLVRRTDIRVAVHTQLSR
jgi:hypothetical protein